MRSTTLSRWAMVGAVAVVLVPHGNLAAQVGEITVTATDYGFAAPDTIEAGIVRVRLVNEGEELHHAQLARLKDGKTIDDLVEALQADGPSPAWIAWVGGPGVSMPGGEANATVALAAGTYAWLCFVTTEAPNREPHYDKGMIRQMVVTGDARPRLPTSATLLMLSDYDFKLSKALTAGRHQVRVRNIAGQTHEVIFVRFHPGSTMDDLMAWIEAPEGPPPADPLGGVMGLDEGEANLVDLDLAPGEYGMLCFVPDKADGLPHIAHGMAKTFTVQ